VPGSLGDSDFVRYRARTPFEGETTLTDQGERVRSEAGRLDVPVDAVWGGFIVHISTWAAQKHIGNAIYGIAKAATDKMAADMAHDPKAVRRSGQVLVAARLAQDYGFSDVDGKRPVPLTLETVW